MNRSNHRLLLDENVETDLASTTKHQKKIRKWYIEKPKTICEDENFIDNNNSRKTEKMDESDEQQQQHQEENVSKKIEYLLKKINEKNAELWSTDEIKTKNHNIIKREDSISLKPGEEKLRQTFQNAFLNNSESHKPRSISKLNLFEENKISRPLIDKYEQIKHQLKNLNNKSPIYTTVTHSFNMSEIKNYSSINSFNFRRRPSKLSTSSSIIEKDDQNIRYQSDDSGRRRCCSTTNDESESQYYGYHRPHSMTFDNDKVKSNVYRHIIPVIHQQSIKSPSSTSTSCFVTNLLHNDNLYYRNEKPINKDLLKTSNNYEEDMFKEQKIEQPSLSRKPSTSSLISTSFDYIRKNLTNPKSATLFSPDSTLTKLSNLISDMKTNNTNSTRSFFKRKNSLTLPVLINLNDDDMNRKSLDRQRSMRAYSTEKEMNNNLVQISSKYGSDFFFPNTQHEYDNINYNQTTSSSFCTCGKPLSLTDKACQYPSCDEDEVNEKEINNKFYRSNVSFLYRSPPSTPPLLHLPPSAQDLLFHSCSSTSSSSDTSILNTFYHRSKSVPSSASSSYDQSGSFDNTLLFNSKKNENRTRSKTVTPLIIPSTSTMAIASKSIDPIAIKRPDEIEIIPKVDCILAENENNVNESNNGTSIPPSSSVTTTALLKSIKTSIDAMKKRLRYIRRFSEVRILY
ncbi:unnamed protein product [Didymodactylos carnosus]|uniref:Uncharacterized protein n=1 Tax=Didymodactylos carnosus TaxID=1234261 RepID=A0A814H7A2_9BILA|nr:unnamed protein product [Didymodactylos carnosus]CAF1006813.1 unnamed protein product [Didymodactylos carnosus]CAF3647576.1 unnamed protein product [Didymodactylos carnosus]CAF3778031.1 unnamed protein product [Didymodactylos carnosus]